MKQESHKITLFRGLPRQSWSWLLLALLASALIHLLSIVKLPEWAPQDSALPRPKFDSSKVTVNVREKPKARQKEQEKPTDDSQKRILETPLAPTEAPKVASRLGAQDHATEKETKISDRIPRPKAADPGLAGSDAQSQQANQAQPLPKTDTVTQNDVSKPVQRAETESKTMLLSPQGSVAAPRPRESQPRNVYESLMPRSEEMTRQVATGYQDYVDDEVEVGERVDLNTTNFRYLGYFTTIRKAFELVWSYPSEAVQRGLQGEVKVEFTILKDGTVSRIKVLGTSGHKILDDAVIEAIKLASPYSPLPDGMKKDKLTIVGSFRYVLTNYAGAL